ncbi:hypothetical protein BCD67_03115 [Oscillatoriales cyanobacterium USR001]|nr:hypothetical protein BCD67_03115 [Oscillatoriales cyanobacterium USR001]
MTIVATRKKFTVEEYHKLGEVGILGLDDRTELIDGDIIFMSPMGTRHASCIDRLLEIFFLGLGKRATITSQTPIRLNGRLEPQPDLSILKRREGSYRESPPQSQDIYLLIEVADTTIDNDRNVKSVLYGKAGIIELWIVDIEADLIEVYRNPSINGYESVQQFRRGESISPIAFPDLVIGVDAIL